MNVILLGAPGAGKGTLAPFLTKKMGAPAISTGNLLREAVANQTPLGQKARQYMDAGKLVPDEVVIGMLKERIMQPDCKNGFILDGFPRTIPQAEALDEAAKIDCALSLEVPDEAIEARMAGRRVCLKCGASYHAVNIPPRREGVCDVCGEALIAREDDRPEVVRGRLATFHEQTEPLKGYYERQGKLKCIDGNAGLENTRAQAAQALGLSV